MKVCIEKIIHGGYGIARLDGGVCLVPFTVPGDLLEIEFTPDGPVSFGWIREVVAPSPHRTQSPCPVFGLCGGCHFDNMAYPCELEVKRNVLFEDLERMAKLPPPDTVDVLSSREYGYRNHAQFKVDSGGSVGFFARRSHEVVPIPIRGCGLLDMRINEFVLKHAGMTPFSRGGFRVRVDSAGQVFQKGIPGLVDDEDLYYSVRGVRFRVNIDDFFQVNRYLIGEWLSIIESYLEPEACDEVADVYSGSGIIALGIASRVRSVAGIEMNKNAVRSAKFNASLNGLKNAVFYRAEAEKGLGSLRRVDKIVLDPPRAGLTEGLVEMCAFLEPKLIVYASCDSATFSRDISRFQASGYVLDRLALVDLFPRTCHFETVSRLVRARG